jgi:hypothetical protein
MADRNQRDGDDGRCDSPGGSPLVGLRRMPVSMASVTSLTTPEAT